MTWAQILASTFLLAGALLALLAGVGLLRMPDLSMRMQSATKAGTLGVSSFSLAAAILFGDGRSIVECVLVVLFVFFTAPVASHMIARVAARRGIEVWRPGRRTSSVKTTDVR